MKSEFKEMIVFDLKKENILLKVQYYITEERIQIYLFQRDTEPVFAQSEVMISDAAV